MCFLYLVLLWNGGGRSGGVVTIIIVGIRDIVGGGCGVVTMAVIVVEYR